MSDIPQNPLPHRAIHPNDSDITRPPSVPLSMKDDIRRPRGHRHRLSASPSGLYNRNGHDRGTSHMNFTLRSTDISPSVLARSVPSVVKTRSGSVLSRGMILKSDHYPSGRALQLDITLHGAPNFRAPREDKLGIFGVAQPRLQGLKAILSVLSCRPDAESSPSQCIWFSTREEPIVYIAGRPYVLRDASEPRKNLALSNRAENLADIESRLKSDILSEASRYGGLILTHLETESDGDGAIVPTWMAIEPNCVLTLSELGKSLQDQAWKIQYHRIPISKAQPIEDNYLDAYLRVLLDSSADPCSTSLLFSCGMGAVRTTFAMCASSIVRRRQLILKGRPDPFEASLPLSENLARISRNGSPLPRGTYSPTDQSRTSTPPGVQATAAMGQFSANQEFSKSLLRLTSILQQCLQKNFSGSVIEWLLSHPSLTENLRKATIGNYGIILSLLGCLDNGLAAKRLVDKVIDSCNHVVNLREDILINRIKYSLTTLEDKSRETYLDKAAQALEKYFFLIAFASYVAEQTDFLESFGDWMKARIEIWNQVTFLRKARGSRLNIFAPVSDLSSLAKSESEGSAFEAGPKNKIAVAGGQVLGDEWTTHVIENRAGIVLRANTLLKSDQCIKEADPAADDIRGAMNFRKTHGTRIYALGQPSLDAIDAVIDRVKTDYPNSDKIVWITLREEPIVYINGTPFCLRRDKSTLRNMKDYSGVSAERLEVMEERLKSDVLVELHSFEGSILLHTETAEGSVVPVWEQVQPDDVCVVKEIMNRRKYSKNVELCYRRIPITSEHPPDFSDFAELLDMVVKAGRDTPIVLNCQLGRGRSSMTSTIICMIQRWLEAGMSVPQTPTTPRRNLLAMFTPLLQLEDRKLPPPPKRHSYKAINHVLRVIRHGRETKDAVDSAIDQCSRFFNLRDAIEDAVTQAEETTDDQERRHHIERGIYNLQRYFKLVIFQAYLNANSPDTLRHLETFESFVKARPVFETFEQEIYSDGIHALKPLEHIELTQGIALSDEVKQVVANRAGTVLSASTILKSDFFSNLQKLSLPERLNGAPNFRRSPLTLNVDPCAVEGVVNDHKQVCGTGIPTIKGLKLVLSRVNAGIDGDNMVAWTSLREEPVLYVAGRPHVLRFLTRPLENVESTGISTAVVEQVEIALKRDVLRELREKNGKLLLHDEMETEPGICEIVAQWENLTEDDIHTPREVFDMVAKEGYKVDYARVPITDEQAPLPSALAQLLERVRTSMDFAGDLIFNCQMGRGRTTTGMVAACLISTILTQELPQSTAILKENELDVVDIDIDDGPSSEEVYSQGEYKVILQLVGVLSYGKLAKCLTDMAIDRMQDVQNLRRAIYDYKLKVDACIPGTPKYIKLQNIALHYLYRYATLIVFANYLVELKQQGEKMDLDSQAFPDWLIEHREISQLLSRRSLD